MVRHIVLFRLIASDVDQSLNTANEMRARLRSLRGLVPGLLTLDVYRDVGTVEGHWDIALVADYANSDALAAYQSHPAHREVVDWIDTVVSDRAVVDYEVPE